MTFIDGAKITKRHNGTEMRDIRWQCVGSVSSMWNFLSERSL